LHGIVQIGEHGDIESDLRQRISSALRQRCDVIAADVAALAPRSSGTATPRGPIEGVGGPARVAVDLLTRAIDRGGIEADDATVGALRRAAAQQDLHTGAIFTLIHRLERSVLDELALDADLGVTTESWPGVAQLVRRASFDALSAVASQSAVAAGQAAVVDPLTTVHTRPLFDVVLSKEADRAGRFGYALALVIFDVDHLAELNDKHGRVIGDRILERLGVLVRQSFRQHDWVARHDDDAIVVMLTRTDADHADDLAEIVRATVADRLGFTDHRSDDQVAVTVSAGVVHVAGAAGTLIDPERLRVDAEAALARAKHEGRNRVVRVDGSASATRALPRSSPST
jgi:diguanylate cyclase (GGDEF)-like protein